MLFEIIHTTIYNYSAPITLGPHTIRLRPRCDGSQRLLDCQLHIEPQPVALADCLDAEGNVVTHAWFNGTTQTLRITAKFAVETLRSNPFDYILTPTARLPLRHERDLPQSLAPYRLEAGIASPVLALSDRLAAEAAAEPLAFVTVLNQYLQRTIEREIRAEGEPQAPSLTLAQGRGACRDLAVLFMAVCRAQGLAARFVSGYQKGDGQREQRYLHAWPEVYLPGGGWRGFDPTHGLAVADAHVAVAAARTAAGAMPIQGAFSGPEVTSELDFELTIAVA